MAKNKLNIILGIDARALERSLGQVQRRLNRFASSLQSTGRTLTESLTVPLAGVGAASLAAFGDIEKLEKGMLAITGSADAAKREIDLLRKAAEAPGLSFEQAVKGSIQLQAVKFSAEEARETISALGQAVALTGGSAIELESVVRQITQINAKGRILQEDIGIIQENAPAVGIALQEAFGTTSVEAIRNSGISAREFTLRLTEAIQQSETFQGVTGGLSNSFENFRNSIKFALAELGRSIQAAQNESFNLEDVMNKLSAAIGQAVNFFKSLTPEARRFVIVTAAIVAGIGPLLLIIGKVISIGPVLIGTLKSIVSTVRSVGAVFTIANLQIFAIVAIIAGVVAGLIALYNRFESVRRVVNAVINVFSELGQIAQESFSALLQGFADLKEGNFRAAAGNFSKAVANVLPGRALGQRLGAALAEGYADESNRIEAGLEALKKRVFSTVEEFTGAAGAIVLSTSGTGTGTGTGAAQKIGIADETVINIPIEFDEEAKVQVEEFALALDRNVAAAARYSDAINLAKQNARIFGTDGLGLVRAELDATKSTIDALLSEGYNPFSDTIQQLGLRYQELTAQIQAAEAEQEKLQDRIQTVSNYISNIITPAFSDFFAAIEIGGQNAFKSLLDGLKKAVVNILKELTIVFIKAVALAAVLSLIFPGSASGGASFFANFKNIISKNIPGFAEGGIVPPGFPGDTFPARLSSGEAVIPLDKLDRYTGGQTVFIPNLTIKGQDFVIAFEKAKASYNRYS
jgi:tape measure domain-containing protein